METHKKLLSQNKAWSKEKLQTDSQFFQRLKDVQKPDFLWIGCSDSRVPPNQITDTNPGDIFVHRNIANMVIHTDLSMLSVLQYAVEVLKVKNIIVCGHYGCGGVRAALSNNQLGLIDNWIRNIKDVYHFYQEELKSIEDSQKKENKLIELNVIEQVRNLAKTSIVQSTWKTEQSLQLHGWIYNLSDGILKELYHVSSEKDISEIYNFNF